MSPATSEAPRNATALVHAGVVRRERLPEHPLRQRGEVGEVLALERLAGPVDAAQAVLDVGGAAWLAEVAVVDDVDARIELPADDLADGVADLARESGCVDSDPLLLGEHRADQGRRAQQAAGVVDEKPVGAGPHRATSRDHAAGAPSGFDGRQH